MTYKGFRGVSLKTTLVDEVENLVESGGRYNSIAAFVSEAVRLRLEKLKKVKTNT